MVIFFRISTLKQAVYPPRIPVTKHLARAFPVSNSYFCTMKPFPWGDDRPYNSYSRFFKEKFGTRAQKVAIDAGFTCPNRDGTLGTGGCHFCNNESFNPSYCDPSKSITQQIDEGIDFHRWRYRKAQAYLAYFQAQTNTYGDTRLLISKYREAIGHPQISGLVIGTRPDCLEEDLLICLEELSRHHFVHIELGIETIYDQTLANINRGHNFQVAKEALVRLTGKGITTGAHFIFGLPGETHRMMLDSAGVISSLPLTTVKFHQLQILKGTLFEAMYRKDPGHFPLFGFEEYIEFIITFLEKLNPAFVVERFAGEVPPRFQAAPGWGMIRNEQIVATIEKRMMEKNTWQGRLFRSITG
jgi:uncharacterized protein